MASDEDNGQSPEEIARKKEELARRIAETNAIGARVQERLDAIGYPEDDGKELAACLAFVYAFATHAAGRTDTLIEMSNDDLETWLDVTIDLRETIRHFRVTFFRLIDPHLSRLINHLGTLDSAANGDG